MNKKGFTLLEVLIGLVILSIGLLAIAGMQVTSVRGNYFSNNLTQASYVAQDRLEILDNSPIDSNLFDAGPHNDGPVTISGIVFNRTYTVDIIGDLRTITYTVVWNEGVNRNISFSTIRSQ
jgi:type IV pilus assembly protein PilV